MKKSIALIFVLLLITNQHTCAETLNFIVAHQVVKERQAAFVLIQKNIKDMADMAKGKREFDSARLQLQMQYLALTNTMLLELFPVGSNIGGTKATASVWDDNEDFMRGLKHYIALTQSIVDSNLNTRQELQEALGKIGKECKSCHNSFKKE